MIYNEKCKQCNCEEYIEWSFGFGSQLFSCKLQGESDDITEIAEDCPFRKELEKYAKECETKGCEE